MVIRTAMASLIVLLSLNSCISLPNPIELRRGACRVEELCLRMTFEECLGARGEYAGDGSECTDAPVIPLSEPNPLYLNEKVIYSVAGTISLILTALVANKKLKARRKRLGTK